MRKLDQMKAGPISGMPVKASWVTALALAGGLVATPQVQAQSVIAHWSFDTPTLSYDGGGNIVGAADSTGNHNAFVDTTTGIGTANSGVNPSGAFAGSDSVSGAFGQGIMFNGNNYLEYPELTELMTSAGAPSYTISLWLNIPSTVTPGNAYETMSDWGNAASTSTTSKYVYGFGPNGTTSMRGQTRSGTGNGTDIYQGNATTPTINDGAWHMLTWTWDTSAGSGESYFDGNAVGAITAKSSPYTMADAASLYGTFGFKGDSGSFIPSGTELDEVWVFNGVLDQNQITGLYTANNINAVPEPGVMVFAGLGMSLLIGLKRFRRAAS